MMISMTAAMAMAMAAPSAQKAEQCASNYTFISMVLAIGGTPENATQEQKDAAINVAAPWYGRALQVLTVSGVIKSGDEMPDSITNKVTGMIDQLGKDDKMIDQIVADIASCDSAYGLQPLTAG